MVYSAYSVRDNKRGFMDINCTTNNEAAIRDFVLSLQYIGSQLHYPQSDFDLFKIGTWDTDTGTFTVLPIPELVCNGYSVVIPKDESEVLNA